MFSSRTIFVVGAGGSFELGLPAGDGLAHNISRKLDYHPRRESGDELIAQAMQATSDAKTHNALKPWYEAASRISQSMPLALSIDNYLHTHSADATVVEIGKIAVARCILEAERGSDIYVEPYRKIDFHSLHENYRTKNRFPSWHNTLFKMLTENVKRDGLDTIFKNVSIITFNYDRCIEHYLVHAFAQFMNMALDEAKDLVATLEIIHPYGAVGDYFGGPNVTGFGDLLDRDRLVKISKQIRTFTEQVVEQDTIDVMAARLESAKNVVFLGFSFGEMNLKLMNTMGEDQYKTIVGTALSVSDSNKEHIDVRLRKILKLRPKHAYPLYIQDKTCHQLMLDFYRMIVS